MGLDSDRYPIRTYGDLALRIMGPRARQVVNVLLCFQLLMCVAVIVLINGNGELVVLVFSSDEIISDEFGGDFFRIISNPCRSSIMLQRSHDRLACFRYPSRIYQIDAQFVQSFFSFDCSARAIQTDVLARTDFTSAANMGVLLYMIIVCITMVRRRPSFSLSIARVNDLITPFLFFFFLS